MKHTKKKRLLAIVLCMILVLSTGIAAFANENVGLQSVACQAATLERVIKNAEGEDVGTLIADIPEGTFLASSSDANIQMDVQADVGADGVLDRVQQQLEANGETGYTLNNYVMADVTFYVNGEKQIPQQPITFHVSGTSIDTENVMAFADDRQNTTTLMDADTDENGGLQFTAQTFGAETVVCGIFDVTEAEEEDENTEEKFAADPVTTGAKVEDETTTQKNDNVQAVANVEKTVSITENYGKLTANYSDTTADVGYVWYRSVNGATAERQIPTQYSSTTGTNLGKDISSDGKELYIALNGGALGYNGNKSVTYTVEAYSKSDLNEYGLPNDGAPVLATSSVYNVTGYYEVQNGSFETPSVTKYHQNTNNWQFSNENYKTLDGVWQTTGTHAAVDSRWSDSEGADIEIVTTLGPSLKRQDDGDRYNWHGDEIAADGNQFAELNCAAAGALYQDVLTTPGEVLNYQVAHRARGSNGRDNSPEEKDTMYVVAMSSNLAKNITTQGQVLAVVNHKENYPGAMVATYTDGDRSWTTHQGTYTVASNQYSTRFFFVAGSTASNDATVGNFIDNVKFTRDRLTPVAGTANVTVTKTITGLSAKAAETLAKQLQFKVGDVRTLSYNDMTWTYENGVYKGSTIVNIPQDKCGNINVKEEGTLDVSGYTRNTSIFVDSTVAGSGITSTNMNIVVGNSRSVEFKNNYSPNGGSGETVESKMFHEKYIKRNDNGTYDITLNASGTIGFDVKKAFVDIVLVVDTSGSMKGSNLTSTKNAINALVDAFDAKKETVDTKYKLVTFSSSAETKTDNWVDGKKLKKKAGELSADGGTNYDQGLSQAATAINSSSRENAKKIVIFLTDGKPTYYGTNPYGYGNETSKRTLEAAVRSASKISCERFYAVGIGLPGSINIYTHDDNPYWDHNSYWHQGTCPDGGTYSKGYDIYEQISGLDILNRLSGAVSASTKRAINYSDPSDLTEEFTSIAGDILTLACSEVTITDTLSEYVDTTANTKIKVNIARKNANNYTDVAGNGREFTLTDGSLIGGEVYEGSDKIATVSYDKDSKTATLKFENDYTFKKDYYYYLSITNVVPNQTAFDKYQNDGYTNQGDDYTDASLNGYSAVGNGTSSKQVGFYSNSQATISYKWKDSNVTENYRKPVVQVEQINVNKNWVGISDPKDTVLVQLIDKSGNPVSGRILELLPGKNYSGSFTVEESDNYGGIRELKLDDTGTINYNGHRYSMIAPDGTTTISGTTYTVTYSTSGNSYTITNTKNTQKIKILKTRHAEGTSDIYLKGAEFTLLDNNGNQVTIGTNTNGTYISGEDGLVLEGDITYGTYILTEVKAPSGYTKLADPITVTVNDDGITVSENTNVKIEKQNNTYIITVANNLLYELPHTGGPGIFLYMIGGMLLMGAAAWILYKNKCREVLKR
ncbi:VWA domain-containing protein [uncultured Eubacterium sp.]|uniref:DUF7604 domain-containing protein n=1 Tax=uncultured Eubacterium sp. TaxID=165185 RepID=UPI0015AA8164|nr:VWA domain-containing protein [uncultured Eubacterium sp.]